MSEAERLRQAIDGASVWLERYDRNHEPDDLLAAMPLEDRPKGAERTRTAVVVKPPVPTPVETGDLILLDHGEYRARCNPHRRCVVPAVSPCEGSAGTCKTTRNALTRHGMSVRTPVWGSHLAVLQRQSFSC